MWRDVCLANRDALLEELDGYTAVLARLRAAIVAGDGATLEAVFARSREARTQWQERGALKAAPTVEASGTAASRAGANGDLAPK
jgi:prephenate dehydrogenase